MKVKDICDKLNLKVLSGKENLDREISMGYCCDLLSRVMAKGKKDGLWITVQTHLNIVAIAVLLELTCIVIPEGIQVEDKTLEKAEEEGVTILSSDLNGYELSGKLYQLGILGE